MRCSTRTLARWSDTASEDQTSEGRCRLGYVIGPAPPTIRGPFHILQRMSKCTGKLVKSSLGRTSYASGEMVDRVTPQREFHAPFMVMSPGMAGLRDCKGLFTQLLNQKAIAEKYLACHPLGIRQG